MTSYFVTGTGTEVGKTYVTAGLIRAGRDLKRDFAAIKPITTGYDSDTSPESDPVKLLGAMGRPVNPRNIATISPWRFSAPMSPDMAAIRESRHVLFDDLVTFCQAAISAAPGTLLIEGVGGVGVPINDTHLVTDWIAALKLPVILVAGTYLGTISHTITAGAFLSAQGVRVEAVVLSESLDSPVLAEETASTLERFISCPIHIIPRDFDDGSFKRLAATLK
jgi:dethiobiotin synthetase